MAEVMCKICEATFPDNVIVDGKCTLCNTLYPKAKTKEDVKIKTKDKGRTLTEEVVKEMVYEILEDAGIKRFTCDKCGRKFFKTSPAQKYCQICKESEDK